MTTQEKIEVMQAYLDGKQIQLRYDHMLIWEDLLPGCEPIWNWGDRDFRVKPEPKLRPYNSAEEFVEAMKEHGPMVMWKSSCLYYMPIETTTGQNIVLSDNRRLTLQEAFDYLFWQDGTTCGIMEETK